MPKGGGSRGALAGHEERPEEIHPFLCDRVTFRDEGTSHSPAAAASQRIGGCPLETCGKGTRTRHASRSHLDDFGDRNLPIPVNCNHAADPVSHGKYPCSHGHLRSSALAGCTGTPGCWLFPLTSPLQGILDPASNQSLLGRIFTGVLAGLGCSRYQPEWEPLSKSHGELETKQRIGKPNARLRPRQRGVSSQRGEARE